MCKKLLRICELERCWSAFSIRAVLSVLLLFADETNKQLFQNGLRLASQGGFILYLAGNPGKRCLVQ